MVLTAIDPNDPQPQRSDPRYKDNYAAFRKADRAWNARESTRRKKVAAADNAASSAPGHRTWCGACLARRWSGWVTQVYQGVSARSATEEAVWRRASDPLRAGIGLIASTALATVIEPKAANTSSPSTPRIATFSSTYII